MPVRPGACWRWRRSMTADDAARQEAAGEAASLKMILAAATNCKVIDT